MIDSMIEHLIETIFVVVHYMYVAARGCQRPSAISVYVWTASYKLALNDKNDRERKGGEGKKERERAKEKYTHK